MILFEIIRPKMTLDEHVNRQKTLPIQSSIIPHVVIPTLFLLYRSSASIVGPGGSGGFMQTWRNAKGPRMSGCKRYKRNSGMAHCRTRIMPFCTGAEPRYQEVCVKGHSSASRQHANNSYKNRLPKRRCGRKSAVQGRAPLQGTCGGPMEPEARCTEAVAILPTNAVKYHVNKVRALEWAKQRGERLRYAIGQDRISATALREKPDLREEKLGWLQQHDQECGGLYGVLPLCIGMPVRATDHLDRGRGILRGCRGVVVGWAKENAPGEGANGHPQMQQFWKPLRLIGFQLGLIEFQKGHGVFYLKGAQNTFKRPSIEFKITSTCFCSTYT